MPLSPNDTERLIKAINRNTAAQLAAAAMAAQHGKSGAVPTAYIKAAVNSVFEEFVKVIETAPE
jgi:hypothetical protein